MSRVGGRRPQKRWKQEWQEVSEPVQVVGNAAMATGAIAGGQLVPLLIVDVADRPELQELFRLHDHLREGEADTVWGSRSSRASTVILVITFRKPIEVEMAIEIVPEVHGGLVDGILQSRAVYLQSGQAGDRLINAPDAKRILVSVTTTGFGDMWVENRDSALMREFRSKGLSKSQARVAVQEMNNRWSEILALRMSDGTE